MAKLGGPVSSVKLPSGDTVEMVYDDVGRLTSRQVTSTLSVVTEHVEFHYAPASDNLMRTVDLLAGSAETNPEVPSGGDEAVYVYYSATNPQEAGASHAGKLEKVVSASGAQVRYEYDGMGRVKTLATKAPSAATEQFT